MAVRCELPATSGCMAALARLSASRRSLHSTRAPWWHHDGQKLDINTSANAGRAGVRIAFCCPLCSAAVLKGSLLLAHLK
jgi:hypothetical protein